MSDSIDVAKARGMRSHDIQPASLSYDHIVGMLAKVTDDFPLDKANRWLGWMQAAIVSAGCGSFDQMREINRFHLTEPDAH